MGREKWKGEVEWKRSKSGMGEREEWSYIRKRILYAYCTYLSGKYVYSLVYCCSLTIRSIQ